MNLHDVISATRRTDMSTGLLVLEPLTENSTEATFAIALDAREPYLDDHRPGGDPLFPTVMAIEAAVSGARTFSPDLNMASVAQIDVQKPFILAARRPHTINLRVVRRTGALGGFDCSLTSLQDGRASTHLRAVVEFHAAIQAPALGTIPVAPPLPIEFPVAGSVVQADAVYQLFFHGPSFRVIGEAQFHRREMLCRLQRDLPPSQRRRGTSETAPRLIEFALQTAGLLELATNGRMKIPHGIGSIKRHRAIDVDAQTTLYAKASYGTQHEACVNIDIVEASGQPVLSVQNYRTETLPFSVDPQKIADLRACFKR